MLFHFLFHRGYQVNIKNVKGTLSKEYFVLPKVRSLNMFKRNLQMCLAEIVKAVLFPGQWTALIKIYLIIFNAG